MPADDRGPTPVALGWDAAWDAAFVPFVGGGRRPARVLAVHKETAIVRDERGARTPGHRDRAVPVRGARPERLPGRRRLGRAGRAGGERLGRRSGGHLGRRPAPVGVRPERGRRQPPDGRQPRRRAGHRGQRRRRVPRRRPRRRLQPAAAWSATSRSPGPAGSCPSSSSTRPTSGSTPRVVASPSRRSRPGVPIVTLSALTGDHLADLAPYLQPGTTAVVLGSSGRRQVHARERAARRGPPGDGRRPRGRFARPAHDHPPRALRAARRRAPHRHPGHPLARGRRRRRGRRDRLRRHHRARDPAAGSATAATAASPAARSGSRSTTARLSQERLASHRKLERELAHAERKEDPRARAAHKREWRLIHKSVSQHMARKYGDDR